MCAVRSFVSSCLRAQNRSLAAVIHRKYSEKTEFKEQKIQVGNHQINYLKSGDGPHNLLFMPGSMGSIWTDFEHQIKEFDQSVFTLIAWDPPGYGKSIPPEREFPLNYHESDANLAVHLTRALNIDQFSVLGWNDGGISSILLAANYPDVVQKAVIWGTSSHVLPTELTVYKNLKGNKDILDKKFEDSLLSLYGKEYLNKIWNKWCESRQNIYNINKGNICMSQLLQVNCPTLILYGAKDPLIHPHHLPMLQSNIRNSRVHIFAEGKHDIHMKHIEDFNSVVTDFLASSN